MSSQSSMASSGALTGSQKTALLTLLGDEDRAIYRAIREKILSFGPSVAEWLGPYALANDPKVRGRVREILNHMDRHLFDTKFTAFCLNQGEDLDVEEGAWLLARTQYPEISVEGYQAVLDSYAGDLRERIDFGAAPESILGTLNDYLFADLKFAGNEQNYYDPDNSYLNRVMDRRTGNPISLCLLYLLLARRLRLPVAGIGMPGHFLTRFQSSGGDLYIDVFNRGKILTKADCVKYLLHTSHGFQEGYLAPVTPRRILLRICSNLHQIYVQLERTEEVARLQRYIVALAK